MSLQAAAAFSLKSAKRQLKLGTTHAQALNVNTNTGGTIWIIIKKKISAELDLIDAD